MLPPPGTALTSRAAAHRALGDPHRLAIVDALRLSDRSPSELCSLTGLPSNLLAFHLDTLEDAGLVERRRSEGDGRRRYVTLQRDALDSLVPTWGLAVDTVLFVCTRNSARSQLAAALWSARTGRRGESAGTDPADAVHPLAVAVAAEHGLDLARARPRHFHDITAAPDLVVSVCDRARESSPAWPAPDLHWSVPDPVPGGRRHFARAFGALESRVEQLALAAAA